MDEDWSTYEPSEPRDVHCSVVRATVKFELRASDRVTSLPPFWRGFNGEGSALVSDSKLSAVAMSCRLLVAGVGNWEETYVE